MSGLYWRLRFFQHFVENLNQKFERGIFFFFIYFPLLLNLNIDLDLLALGFIFKEEKTVFKGIYTF